MKHNHLILIISLTFVGCTTADQTPNIAKESSINQKDIIYQKGITTFKNKKYNEAAKYIKEAAMHGHIKAMKFLGNMYVAGVGVPKDYQKGFYWFKQVLNQRPDAESNHMIADLYREGNGVKVDYKKALTHYHIASKMGKTESTSTLGYMYEYGLGMKIDIEKARKHYIEAATKGNIAAINNLGTIAIRNGNYKLARQWFNKAAAMGAETAMGNLKLLNTLEHK